MKKVNSNEFLSYFCKEMFLLMKTAMTIKQALELLKSTSKNKYYKNIYGTLLEKIETGVSFSNAIKEYPNIFSTFFVSSIYVGEKTGQMKTVFENLAIYYKKRYEASKKLRATFIYPATIFVISFFILSFVLNFIYPKLFKAFFFRYVQLPKITKFVILTIDTFNNNFIFIAIGMVLSFILFKYSYQKITKFRYSIDKLLYSIPVFGSLVRANVYYQFFSTMKILTANGLKFHEAIEIVKDSVENEFFKSKIYQVIDDINVGVSFYDSIAKTEVFEEELEKMIKVGEKTNSIDEISNYLSEIYEFKVDTTLNSIVRIMEPIFILIIGLIISIIVISVFLPVFKMSRVI